MVTIARNRISLKHICDSIDCKNKMKAIFILENVSIAEVDDIEEIILIKDQSKSVIIREGK
jgi:hypothetical protein